MLTFYPVRPNTIVSDKECRFVLDEELGTEFRVVVSCAVRNPPV